MINLDTLKAFGEAIVADNSILKRFELIDSESAFAELEQNMSKNDTPILIGVMPSADGDDNDSDNVAERSEMLLSVLEVIPPNSGIRQRFPVWKQTSEAMTEVKEFIHKQIEEQSVYYELLSDCNFNKRRITPEYNYMGFMGWTLVFDYSVSGF